jgi:hypothetical protein
MGSSPREQQASTQLNYLRSLAPQVGQPTFDLQGVLKQVLGGIDTSTSHTTSALSQNVGAQLSGAGVAGGQPRSEAYISALSPVYAEASKNKALLTSDLSKFGAENTLDARKLLLALTGQEGDIMKYLKGTTTTGDILGGITTGAGIFGKLFAGGPMSLGMQILQMLSGGSSGSPDQTKPDYMSKDTWEGN